MTSVDNVFLVHKKKKNIPCKSEIYIYVHTYIFLENGAMV